MQLALAWHAHPALMLLLLLLLLLHGLTLRSQSVAGQLGRMLVPSATQSRLLPTASC